MSNSSTYTAPAYLKYFHEAPRFGHSDNLASVVTRDEGYSDYAQGTIFIGSFILAVFFVWISLLGVFHCIGRGKVGVLAGRRLLESENGRRHTIYRVVVLVSCIGSLLSSMMFLVKVTASLESTLEYTVDAMEGVADIVSDVTNITDQLIESGRRTTVIRDATVRLLNEGACNSFLGGNGHRIEFDDQAESVVESLTQLSDFSKDDLIELSNNFQPDVAKTQRETNIAVDESEDYARVGYYSITTILLSSFLAMGAFMALVGCENWLYFKLQSWVVLPAYVIVLVLTVIATAALGSVLIVNSDVCLGGENENPESFLSAIADVQILDAYPQTLIDFYFLNGCEGDFVGYNVAKDLLGEVKDGKQAVVNLREVLEAEESNFQARCEGEEGSLNGLKSDLDSIDLAFSAFILTAQDAVNLLECKPINDLYKDVFHVGICKNLPGSVHWMFVTNIIVVAFGMIIFTLRSALLPSSKENEIEDSCCGGGSCCRRGDNGNGTDEFVDDAQDYSCCRRGARTAVVDSNERPANDTKLGQGTNTGIDDEIKPAQLSLLPTREDSFEDHDKEFFDIEGGALTSSQNMADEEPMLSKEFDVFDDNETSEQTSTVAIESFADDEVLMTSPPSDKSSDGSNDSDFLPLPQSFEGPTVMQSSSSGQSEEFLSDKDDALPLPQSFDGPDVMQSSSSVQSEEDLSDKDDVPKTDLDK